jgi:hypothetical protein
VSTSSPVDTASAFPPADSTAPTLVVWDAAAYRRLAAAAGDDVSAARARALDAGAAASAAGLAAAASPVTLWALLADLAPRAADAGGRAQAALAACVAHTLAASGEPPPPGAAPTGTTAPDAAAPSLRLAPDPETVLAEAALGRTPPQHVAWNAYLASLAVDAAAALSATPGGAGRLAGPLAHVLERATQQQADLEDEIQDAVLAAYDASSGSWNDAAGVDERQATVAGAVDALERAVVAGRAVRAATVATAGSSQQQQDERDRGANLFDPAVLTLAAGRVRGAFAPGIRLWAALVAEVVAGRVVPASRGWRGALWGAQVAFIVGSGAVARVVSGSEIVRVAARRAGAGDAIVGA